MNRYEFSSGIKKSYIKYSLDNPFPIENIPFGVYRLQNSQETKVGVAIGEYILDVGRLAVDGHLKYLSERAQKSLQSRNLNDFFSLSRVERSVTRSNIQNLLEEGSYF